MVKKYTDDDKPIVAVKAQRKRYVRKANVKQPKLDVKDFLPKMLKKSEAALKQDILKIKQVLDSEYSQLKKKVEKRKEEERAEIVTKSTETEVKEKEKEDKKLEKQLDESKLRISDMSDALKSDSKSRDKTLNAVMLYLQNMSAPKPLPIPRMRMPSAVPKVSKKSMLNQPIITVTPVALVTPPSPTLTITPSPASRTIRVKRLLPTPKAKTPKATTPLVASLITQVTPPVSQMPSPVGSPIIARAPSPPTVGGAGFKKKHVNIALLGKEEQFKQGDISVSLAREMRQLRELKRNKAVVIPNRDLIDAERPINYELGILQ